MKKRTIKEKREERDKLSGEITVYLALSMTILLALVLSVIESARVNTIRFQIECAADMSLYSALAEYHRELLEQYDLFFVDVSYGSSRTGLDQTQWHLKEYLDYNLDSMRELILPGARDLLALSAKDAEVVSVSLATDEDCLVLKSQAVSYMKERTGISLAEEILGNMQYVQQNHMEEGIEEERERNRREIKERDGKRIQTADGEWKEIHIDDPVGHIPVRDSGLAYLVTKGSGGVSGSRIEPSAYVSSRVCNQGDGLAPERQAAEGIADEVLFGEYLLTHLSRYTDRKEGTRLQYELEYVLGGKENDAENLKYVLNRILLIREAANYLYLQQDSVKQTQAQVAALSVSAVLFMPELAEILKEGILLAWAYTESVNDIKILLEKGRVPLQKGVEDWKMGFIDMLHYETALTGGSGCEGLSYEDYLRIFLLMGNRREKAVRFADVVEMDIRGTVGNEAFRMDHCLESMEVHFAAESRYGYEYEIQKRYGYEMLE
ncbi:MAG: hypothetical protein GX234_01540 [Clostridiales bacterium]|nr:hypothetical protein [Clostridiales bacterium]